MRLSYHSFGFAPFVRWTPCYTLEDTVNKLAAIGYEGIELGAVRPHAWPYDLDASDRRRFLRLLRKEKMEVSAICPTAVNYNVASSLNEERIAAVHYYEECIKMAADLECDKMLYIPGWVTWEQDPAEAWAYSVETLSRLAKAGERYGVTIMVEQINNRVVNLVTTVDQTMAMVEEVSSTCVGVVLDTYHHFAMNEDPAQAAFKYGEKLQHVHCEGAIRNPPGRRIPGEGDLDLIPFLKALKNLNYQGYLSVELFESDPEETAEKSLGNLKKMLEMLEKDDE